jgi:leucine dehydrogenase
MQRGILYAPDFLINAGGVINCYSEVLGNYSKEQTMSLTDMIYNRVLEIYLKSEIEKINTQQAAISIAKERIEKAKNLNAKW